MRRSTTARPTIEPRPSGTGWSCLYETNSAEAPESASDSLTGGAGNDTFKYLAVSDSTTAAPDGIQDFTSGSDKIDVSAVYSGTFTWTLFPTGSAGQWWFSADGSTPNLYHLFFDVDGGGADMKIDVLTTGGGIATTDIIG